MSVVGFDFGNQSCFVAVARQGGIEVMTNDYSLHATPSCVSFGAKNRSMGVASRQQMTSNYHNTIINFKHLIGRKFSDSVTQRLRPFVPCQMVQLPDDNIGLQVEYLGEKRVFAPEQILAALLVKLKQMTETSLGETMKVVDCVVSVPYYFTDCQRRSLLTAIQMAGLNGLRIVNETTAIALAYGIYKTDLPPEGETPRIVAFIDIGHSATQAVLVAYNKAKLTVLGATMDMEVSGMALDILIRDHFRDIFVTKFGVDAATSGRASLRLLDECEKLKKQMSANSTAIPLNIECFMNDKDVSGSMQRSEFEQLASGVMQRLDRMLRFLLEETKIAVSSIESVEMVGGSSRVPAFKRVVTEVFGKEPKTTMNLDDTVARGAAMQCAILSPSFRVREFSMKDCQPYRIKLAWGSFEDGGENDVFNERDEFPYSKMLTLYRKEPFTLTATYSMPNQVPHSKREIGTWKVNNLTSNETGEARKVKVKARINPNGIFTICSATIFDAVPQPPSAIPIQPAPEPMDTPAPVTPAAGESMTNGETAMSTEEEKVEATAAKIKTIATELPIEETTPLVFGQSSDVARFVELEKQMQQNDWKEKAKADAKNAVEEYIYEMREKLSGSLKEFVTEQDSEKFNSLLCRMEDWLYGEGEDADIKAYEDQLIELKKLGDPIVERFREDEARTPAARSLGHSIQMAQKEFDLYVRGDEKYAHIESKDMDKVLSAVEEKRKWLDETLGRQSKHKKFETPVVFAHQIDEQKRALESVVRLVLNKPKPKPPAAPPVNNKEQSSAASSDQTAEKPSDKVEMEVD